MKTTRILLVVALAMVVSVPVLAQEKKRKSRTGRLSTVTQALMRMEKVHKLMKSLDLTDEQEQEIKSIHSEVGPKMKGYMESLKEIVTDEQQATVEAAAKEAKEAGKEGAAFFKAIEESITLTDEQKTKVDELGKEMGALHRATMKKTMGVLTKEQKEAITAKMRPVKNPEGKKQKAKKPE